MAFTMERPMPLPPYSLVLALSTLKNFTHTLSRSSSGIGPGIENGCLYDIPFFLQVISIVWS